MTITDKPKLVEMAIDLTLRMQKAREALKDLVGDRYASVVSPWRSSLREMCSKTGKGPIELLCDIVPNEHNALVLWSLYAATLENVEEDAAACA